MFLVRWVYRLLAVLSLVLLGSVVALWFRSRDSVDDYCYWTGDQTHCTGFWLITSPGSFTVHIDWYTYPADHYGTFIKRGCSGRTIPYVYTNRMVATAFKPSAWFERPWRERFDTISDTGSGYWDIPGLTFRRAGFAAPTSAFALTFAILPAVVTARLIRAWRRRRRPAHLCPACRYDLRAPPAAAGPLLSRCPECGHTLRTTQPATSHVS